MRRRPLLAVAVFVTAAVAGGLLLRGNQPSPAGQAIPATPPGTVGLIATTDDGEKSSPTAPLRPEFSTSGEGLVTEPSPVPGGGVMIDLQGRFQQGITATVADTDSVAVECGPEDRASRGGNR